MPEFGQKLELAQGTPCRLGFATGDSLCSVELPTCPDGFTIVLLGVDAWGAASEASALTGGLSWSGGEGLWAATAQLVSPAYEDGVSWRGQLPYAPGEYLIAEATLNVGPVQCGVSCWGLLLPFVIYDL